MYSRALPEAFLARGASIVFGWDGPVGVDYVDGATLSLLRHLFSEGMDAERAVEAVMRDVGPDPDCGSRLGYYRRGVREIFGPRLAGEIRPSSPVVLGLPP